MTEVMTVVSVETTISQSLNWGLAVPYIYIFIAWVVMRPPLPY